jgi:predicted nucleic acid-binding protein
MKGWTPTAAQRAVWLTYARAAALNRQYPDLGFVDAAVIAIAEARVRRIATSDRRHFAPLARPLSLDLVP